MTRALRYRSHLTAIFFAMGIFFAGVSAATPVPVAAITCSECATAFGQGLGACQAQYDTCLDPPGDESGFSEDMCSYEQSQCEEPVREANTACLSQCEEPAPADEGTGEAPTQGAATTQAEPAALSSPGFSTLLSQGILRANISPACKSVGKCQITDMIQIGLNVMTFILGISGSVFLLMFVYGGFMWLTSAGSPDKISGGLDTLRDAIVGLIVVFGAYTLVNSVLSLVRYGALPTGDINNTLQDITPVKTIEIKSQ